MHTDGHEFGEIMADFLEWRVERVGVVDSTNRVAGERVMELWGKGESAAGVVVVAERQSAGRGQHGRVWESPAGGLYLSAVVVEVAIGVRDKLALVAGVAGAEGLRRMEGVEIGLRWPNDLMLEGRKVGGILCESVVQGKRWAGIIGVGLNINTRLEELPAEVQRRATSLLAHDGQRRDAGKIELIFLEELAETLRKVAAEGLERLVRRVRQLDTLEGKAVEFQDGERRVFGVAAGIGDSGELLIRTDKGIEAFVTGSVIAVGGERLRG